MRIRYGVAATLRSSSISHWVQQERRLLRRRRR